MTVLPFLDFTHHFQHDVDDRARCGDHGHVGSDVSHPAGRRGWMVNPSFPSTLTAPFLPPSKSPEARRWLVANSYAVPRIAFGGYRHPSQTSSYVVVGAKPCAEKNPCGPSRSYSRIARTTSVRLTWSHTTVISFPHGRHRWDVARAPGGWADVRAGCGGQLRPAMTPPSTSQMAPVTQLVAGESKKVMVLARSRAVPTRPIRWKPSKLCRVSSSLSAGTNLS